MSQVSTEQDVSSREYQGLVKAVSMIARHPHFPGKEDAVRECVSDILERSLRGRLSPVQRIELLSILLADGPRGVAG
jgi:hypothetical protein